MMFNQFDIDYDKITINGVEIPKPRGTSCVYWLDFWKECETLTKGETVQDMVDSSVDDAITDAINDRDGEWEDERDRALSNLDVLEIFDDLSNEHYEAVRSLIEGIYP